MSTRQIVDAFFQNFSTGDIEAVKSLFAPELTFAVHGSPDTPWAGTRTSRDDLDTFFAAFSTLGPASDYRIDHILVDDSHAVALGRNAFPVIATGKTFTNHFALHLVITEGQITGYQMYEDSYAIHEAFVPNAS